MNKHTASRILHLLSRVTLVFGLLILTSCAADTSDASIIGCAISPQGKWVALSRAKEGSSSLGGITYSVVVFSSAMDEYDVFEYLPRSLPNSGNLEIKFINNDELLVRLPKPDSVDRQQFQVDGLHIHYVMY